MKNTIRTFLLAIFTLAFINACQNHSEKGEQTTTGQPTQQTINKQNDARLEGDHVTSDEEIPVLSPEEKQAYIDKAKSVAKNAFTIFSGHLKTLFAEKKPEEALEFCHDNALKITDSLAKAAGVEIKRTSYRLRNPKNKPTPQEEKVMEIYRKRILKNLKPEPYFHYDNHGYPHVYIPIMVQQKCLICHGDPNKDIPDNINNKLAKLYPNDKAIFFKVGDLRGIWSIKFPKNKKN